MKTARLVSLSMLTCAGALAVACGSSSDTSGNNGSGAGNTDKGGGVVEGSKPTYGPGFEACSGLKSGFDGDGYCITAPDPSLGFQVHYGPSNYDDQAEVAKYVIHPGEEITDCVFMKTPNDMEVFHSEYHGRMRPGSHHMLVFTQTANIADSTGPTSCNQGLDEAMILGAQTPVIDVDRNKNAAPENAGYAQKLAAHAQGVIQMHFINATQHDLLREGWATVLYRDPTTVTQLASPIFFIGGYGMNILPGTSQVLTGTADPKSVLTGSMNALTETRLLAGTGHFHAHTVRFSAYATISGERKQIIEDYNWHEPSMFSFDTVTNNTLWDKDSQTAGGASGAITLKAGDSIDWECEVVNDSSVALKFANEVYTGEMCNMFGIYGPSNGTAWAAANIVSPTAKGTPIN